MKAKKIASLLLAVLMLVSMLALPVSATEADVAKIGEKTYATLEDAFADAPNKATITLLSDVTLTSSIEIGNGKDITVEGLFRRDVGKCWLCGERCNFEDYTVRDGNFIVGDWYPSIDHVIPLVKGGKHSWANVKLAHHRCNSIKHDKII